MDPEDVKVAIDLSWSSIFLIDKKSFQLGGFSWF